MFPFEFIVEEKLFAVIAVVADFVFVIVGAAMVHRFLALWAVHVIQIPLLQTHHLCRQTVQCISPD